MADVAASPDAEPRAATPAGPASAVTGNWASTYGNGRGKGTRAVGLANLTVGVWSGERFIKGAFAQGNDGTFEVPEVPAGPFILAIGNESSGGWTMVASPGQTRAFDLGADVLGSPVTPPPVSGANTALALALTGLAPWAAGDSLMVWHDVGISYLYRSVEFAAGATMGTLTMTLGQRESIDGPGRGEQVVITQMGASTLPDGATFALARAAATTRALRTIDGQTVMASEALQVLPTDGAVATSIARSQFVPLGPLGMTGGPSLALAVRRSPPDLAHLGARDTATVSWPAGTNDVRVDVRETNPYPAEWTRTAEVTASFPVSVFVPGAMPPLVASVSLRTVDRAEALLGAPVTPKLGPPRAPQVEGRAADQVLEGVGLTPLLSWSAPALGQPTLYKVSIRRIDVRVGSINESTRATINTTATEVRLPPDLLKPGEWYRFRVRAIAADAAKLATVGRTSLPWFEADLLSERFSP